MSLELQSMGVEMPEVKGHPNRVAFRGVLTVVDVASTRAPQGSKGKRVLLTRRAAEAALPSLIGMALDYTPSFDGHDARRKVGVITKADLVGRNLEVGGYLYAKDFPEIVEEVGRSGGKTGHSGGNRLQTSDFRLQKTMSAIQASRTEGARLRAVLRTAVQEIRGLIESVRNRKGDSLPVVLRSEASGGSGAGLGMSFEVTNVEKESESARVWVLTRVMFTGAAILRKDRAAFQDTWIELVSA